LVRSAARAYRLRVEGHKHGITKCSENVARQFAEKFSSEHGLELVVDETAIRRLVERAQAERMTMSEPVRPFILRITVRLDLIKQKHGSN